MGRPRIRLRSFPMPTFSTFSLLCISALSALAVLSILSGHLPDMDQLVEHPIIGQAKDIVDEQELDSTHQILRQLKQSSAWQISRGLEKENLWISEQAKAYYGCSNPSTQHLHSESGSNTTGYLMIEASGGLNQQRIGITDAVVVARILNATLVLPHLDHNSFWKDNSNFSDIFDVEWFIEDLAGDVRIVKEVPSGIINRSRHHPVSIKVPRKCLPSYYESKILPVLLKKQVLRIRKFDFRLANKLDTDLQKLRCKVNYNSLRFTQPIWSMGQSLVSRMRQMGGRYIALHLRFEPDMLAFSGCYYGGGEKERKELGAIRKRWKTLRLRSPERERRNGKCPLTPLEVGLMLRALGFSGDSYLYVASGEIYGGEETLAPLKMLFPNFVTKETLATDEELRPFAEHSSQMAAIDYVVCDESDVFVTNNNGNMARVLAGRRRYFGHKRTIRPNTKKLGQLFMAKHSSWEQFAGKLKHLQKGFMGDPNEVRPGRGSFHEHPWDCICRTRGALEGGTREEQGRTLVDDSAGDTEGEEDAEQEGPEDEPSFFDMDDVGASLEKKEVDKIRADDADDLYVMER